MSFDTYEKWSRNRLEIAERLACAANLKAIKLREAAANAEKEADAARKALVVEQTFLLGPEGKKQFFSGMKKRYEQVENSHSELGFYKLAATAASS